MLQDFKKLIRLEKDSQFSTRVLILSLPSAILFITLTVLGILSPAISLLCYTITIIFNMFSLFPISYEMQSLRRYIYSLLNENELDTNLNLSDKEAKEIADAIKTIHRYWTSKADTLEAQTISDAAVLDTLPDPILMIDGEGNITGANSAAKKLLGSDISNKNVDNIFKANIFISAVEKILKGKNNLF